MTLGSGAWHSEQNASGTEAMRFIQMWILPAEPGLTPGVEQKVFTDGRPHGSAASSDLAATEATPCSCIRTRTCSSRTSTRAPRSQHPLGDGRGGSTSM